MRITARKPTEAKLSEAMANKPVYKVVRVLNGKLYSLWADGTRANPQFVGVGGCKKALVFRLTYARGKLSDNGKYGIWCCKTMKDALNQARNNGCGSLCHIYQAYPIGSPIPAPKTWEEEGIILYPAIILGREVVGIKDYRYGGLK